MHSRLKNLIQSFVCCAAVAFYQSLSTAQGAYNVTIVVDSNSPTFANFSAPSISSTGALAFSASLDSGAGGGTGIFSSTAGTTSTIALSTNPLFFSFGPVTAINAAGIVAFYSNLDAGGTGLFVGSGGSTTTIALSSQPTFSSFSIQLSMNESGTVAFYGNLDTGPAGIFTWNGGTLATVITSGGSYLNFGEPFINSGGTAAFFTSFTAGSGGGSGILTSSGGTPTTIALSSGASFNAFGLNPSINSSGLVAFRADTDSGDTGIFTSNGVGYTAVALASSATFDIFTPAPLINSAGQVAFLAGLDGGGTGIYTGNGSGSPSRVIGTGDSLDGSTVTGVSLNANAFNDAGQIGFAFSLADGRTGVAVASVPEPGTASLILIGAYCFLACRQRRARW